MHGDAKQRAGSNNIVAVPFILTEILEALQSRRNLLDFIQDDQGILRFNLHAAFNSKTSQNPIHTEITGEQLLHTLVSVKIDIGTLFKVESSEFLHQPGFSDLSGTANNQRQPMGIFLPVQQLLHCKSFHPHHQPFLVLLILFTVYAAQNRKSTKKMLNHSESPTNLCIIRDVSAKEDSRTEKFCPAVDLTS